MKEDRQSEWLEKKNAVENGNRNVLAVNLHSQSEIEMYIAATSIKAT